MKTQSPLLSVESEVHWPAEITAVVGRTVHGGSRGGGEKPETRRR